MLLLPDFKQGDIVRVVHPASPEGRLAIVDAITSSGSLKVRMRHRTAGFRWGVQREISLRDVIAIELRNWEKRGEQS